MRGYWRGGEIRVGIEFPAGAAFPAFGFGFERYDDGFVCQTARADVFAGGFVYEYSVFSVEFIFGKKQFLVVLKIFFLESGVFLLEKEVFFF